MNRLTDTLPVLGGATGAVLTPEPSIIPTWETFICTIILAAVGAAVGYLVKLLLDYLFNKHDKKSKIEHR
jgi:H+/Cl- antiporter ClcA